MTDNETIAEFDGIKLIQMRIRSFSYWENSDGDRIDYHDVNYGKYWGQFMPAWYKFKDLKIEGGYSNDTIAQISKLIVLKRKIGFAILHRGPTPAEACRLLAEGIRWYNTINKQ
jgi:hypothetical protein